MWSLYPPVTSCSLSSFESLIQCLLKSMWVFPLIPVDVKSSSSLDWDGRHCLWISFECRTPSTMGPLFILGAPKGCFNNDREIILNKFTWNPCVTPHLISWFWRGIDETRITITTSCLFESCVERVPACVFLCRQFRRWEKAQVACII